MERVEDGGAQNVARLGDHGDRVPVRRIRDARSEPEVVRALQEHIDRSPGPGPKMLGERSRRHQHEVRGVQLLIFNRLRVADDPEDVALADGTADRLETSEHDVDVAHPTGQAIGIPRRLNPHLRPGPSQAASKAFGEVPVAPTRRDFRRRRGDGQHQA